MVTSVCSFLSLSLVLSFHHHELVPFSLFNRKKREKNELSLLISVIVFLFSEDEPIVMELIVVVVVVVGEEHKQVAGKDIENFVVIFPKERTPFERR